jgi:MFS transporter, AAHS family, 4-hydroxybenzoate transporter
MMAQTPASAIETALENQRLGPLQFRVAALCTLVQMCDGYDVGSIGWAVPSLTHAWHVAPATFGLAFLFSNIGVMVGALVAGPVGDRFGRKPLLLASLAIFGLASLLSAQARSIEALAFLRFFTGLGIAGGFAGCTALTGDYTPQRLRGTMIMVTFTGAPLGGFLGGQVIALLLSKGFAWPIIFVIGGVFPLALLMVTAPWLPESPRFLASRTALAPRHRALLQRLDVVPAAAAARGVDVARGNPIAMLFGEGYALQTTLMWIIFFCSLLTLYLYIFWMPEILHLTGMTPAQSVFATSLHALGGIVAVVYLGYLIDRFGAQRALAAHYVAAAVCTAVIALAVLPYLALLGIVFLSGTTVIGSQTGANAACGVLYPARMRTSGIGWALGIGRLGGIAAAPLGGFLLARGLPPRYVFLSGVALAIIAAVATALLALRAPRGERPADPPTAARVI